MKSKEMISGSKLESGMIISDGKNVMEVKEVIFRSFFRVRFTYRDHPNGNEWLSGNYAGQPEFYFHGYANELLAVA